LNTFTEKKLKTCFIILAPEHSLNLIKDTANSIKYHYPDLPFSTVVDSSATKEFVLSIKSVCPVYKANETISSMINVGMRHASGDWVFLIFAGTNVRPKLDSKFAFYVDDDKDILYPVADNKYNFIDATLNGLFINKKTFRDTGELEESGNLNIVKTVWASNALEKGCRFKAIVGSKMC
jgi:hypothetical protein